MKQMEERYKKYLEKAKSVIRTLDPKQNQGSAPEVQALKNQLQERERMMHTLEKEYDKTKTQRDQEEKLIVTAWYNMGMALQKKAAEDRLASTGSGQSFLARQRQATSTRRVYPGHVQPTAARCFITDEASGLTCSHIPVRLDLTSSVCFRSSDHERSGDQSERVKHRSVAYDDE
ncbi:hypothetical protein cypCar_00046444, partial [Cyprinus carpio]